VVASVTRERLGPWRKGDGFGEADHGSKVTATGSFHPEIRAPRASARQFGCHDGPDTRSLVLRNHN
jgi:hypothetical protein